MGRDAIVSEWSGGGKAELCLEVGGGCSTLFALFNRPPFRSPGYITIPAAIGSYNGGAGQISYLAAPVFPIYAAVTPAPTPTVTASPVSASPLPQVWLAVNISAQATTFTVGGDVAADLTCQSALITCLQAALTGLVPTLPSTRWVVAAATVASTTRRALAVQQQQPPPAAARALATYAALVTWQVLIQAPASNAADAMSVLSDLDDTQLQGFTLSLDSASNNSTGTPYVSAAAQCGAVAVTSGPVGACPGTATTPSASALPLAAIIGGSVGGAALLAIIITTVVCCTCREACCGCCCAGDAGKADAAMDAYPVAVAVPVPDRPAKVASDEDPSPTPGVHWANSYRGGSFARGTTV
jgi:hypothetical protein